MTKTLPLAATVLAVMFAAFSASAEQPVELKFSRVVDLTLPVETNMAGIPGFKIYADNPSLVSIISAMTDAQKELLRAEGLSISDNVEINGRAMISILHIMTHNGTHIDAPRHMMENGFPIDRLPLSQVAKEGVIINLSHKGPNSSVSVQDIIDTGVRLGPDRIPMIYTGWTEKTWGTPEFWSQMPYLEPGVGEYLASKAVPAVGMDLFPERPLWRGVKPGPGEVWQVNHLALMNKGIPLLQFVTNLSQIGSGKFVVVALPMKMKGADGAPARVIALVE
jgi:arylformamidase